MLCSSFQRFNYLTSCRSTGIVKRVSAHEEKSKREVERGAVQQHHTKCKPQTYDAHSNTAAGNTNKGLGALSEINTNDIFIMCLFLQVSTA